MRRGLSFISLCVLNEVIIQTCGDFFNVKLRHVLPFLQATLQTYQTVSKKFNGQIIVHYRRTNTVIITREG